MSYKVDPCIIIVTIANMFTIRRKPPGDPWLLSNVSIIDRRPNLNVHFSNYSSAIVQKKLQIQKREYVSMTCYELSFVLGSALNKILPFT